NHQDIIIQQAELLSRTSIADQSGDGIALSNFTDPLKTDQFKPLHKTPIPRFFSATRSASIARTARVDSPSSKPNDKKRSRSFGSSISSAKCSFSMNRSGSP